MQNAEEKTEKKSADGLSAKEFSRIMEAVDDAVAPAELEDIVNDRERIEDLVGYELSDKQWECLQGELREAVECEADYNQPFEDDWGDDWDDYEDETDF